VDQGNRRDLRHEHRNRNDKDQCEDGDHLSKDRLEETRGILKKSDRSGFLHDGNATQLPIALQFGPCTPIVIVCISSGSKIQRQCAETPPFGGPLKDFG
jgi:hypothetical protein